MKVNIDENRVLGAIAVLENYLDGAVADYEDDQIENVEFIEDCIYVRHVLELVSTKGFSSLVPDEYAERVQKAKERR